LCATTSTKTLCLSSLRSSLLLRMGIQDKFSLPSGYQQCTMQFGHLGNVSLVIPLNRTLTISTSTSTRSCMPLVRRECTSILGSSGAGSSFQFGMELHATSVVSMDWLDQLTLLEKHSSIGSHLQLPSR